jgi:hypothetical protein
LTKWNILGLTIGEFGASLATIYASAVLAIAMVTGSEVNVYRALLFLGVGMVFYYMKKLYEEQCKDCLAT